MIQYATEIKAAEHIVPGDVVMPPAREVSLWFRRACAERGLPESAMWLTVREVREGLPDKRGRWVIVKADHSEAWQSDGRHRTPFTFKARPETSWTIIAESVPVVLTMRDPWEGRKS